MGDTRSNTVPQTSSNALLGNWRIGAVMLVAVAAYGYLQLTGGSR